MSDLESSARIQSGTVGGAIDFLDFVVKKGYGSAAAISPWKSAVRQVFSTVDGDDYLDTKVTGVDLDEYLGRFEVMARGQYKQESIQAYRSRVTKAIDAYVTFLQTGTPPSFRERAPRVRAEKSSRTESVPVAVARHAPAHVQTGGEPMIEYPFPLTTGQVATLRLPVRLEKGDAERLGTFVRTLVFDGQKQLTTGGQDSE